MTSYKTIFCTLAGLLLVTATHAQRYMGIATSEWSATNALYLNPAAIAGSHEKITISILSFNLGVDNNLGTFSSLKDLTKINSNDTGGTNKIFTNAGRQHFSMILPAVEMRGPGVLVSINKKAAIALTTRVRVISQFNNFDQSLYSQITDPSKPAGDYGVATQKFNWTAHLWSEIGLTYGMVVMDNDMGQLKAGVTLRHLSGVGYVGLKANNLDLKYAAGKDSFAANNTDLEFASNVVSANSAVFSGIDASSMFSNLFSGAQGGGFGADLGVTYSRVLHFGGGNSHDDNGHKISASAAITDIGAINYKKTNYTVNVTGNGYLSGQKISDYQDNFDSIKAYAVRQHFSVDTGNQPTKVHMPTALIIGADYQVYGHFSVNATYIANLVDRQQFGNSVYNQVTITPRYDVHLFTVALPVTYSSLAGNMKLGLGLRLAGFFLGSDDMLALISRNQYGFNIYFGGYVPICRKKKKDSMAMGE